MSQSAEGFYVCTAEDTILQKLRWSHGSLSEKQWRDVQGILRMQGEALNVEYMVFWAGQIEVVDCLEQAMRESGMR